MSNMEKTKLYVLTGFLGSGKTTILSKILNQLKNYKVGIIQNEFGKISIDGTILQDFNVEIEKINKGSIFCSCLKLNFVQTLSEMVSKDFQYLFVESSGLGDPSNVEEILKATKVLSGKDYDFKGVICLVDGLNFLNQLEDLETVYRQLKHCNLAIITKTDLVDSKTLETVKEKIKTINPLCKIQFSCIDFMDYSFLKEDLLANQWAKSEDTTNTEETKPKTLFMDFKDSVDKDSLINFLNAIKNNTYRIKGFFNIKDLGFNQVDVVGNTINFKPCKTFEKSQLVFISKIGPALIKEIFSSWEENVGLEMKLRN